MPTLYDITFSKRAVDLLPPDKRGPITIAFFTAMLTPLQWCRDLIFGLYKVNSTAPVWSAGTYSLFSIVEYNKALYYATVTTTATPGTNTDWLLIQNNFIGVDERILYNGTKLIFEYALNRWFKTTFRQPGGSNSDIYLTTNAVPVSPLVAGLNYANSSTVFKRTSSEFVINGFSFAATYGLTINMPVAVYNALASTGPNRDKTVRQFADKYVTTGIFYNILTY